MFFVSAINTCLMVWRDMKKYLKDSLFQN